MQTTMRRLAVTACSVIAATSAAQAAMPDQRPKAAAVVASGEWRSGFHHGRAVSYRMIHGRAVAENDIVLDQVTATPAGVMSAQQGAVAPQSVGINYQGQLWPKVGSVYQVPYTIAAGSSALTSSLAKFNSTFTGLIQFVARSTETDYVEFFLDPDNHNGAGQSSVGRVGGKQQLYCSVDCVVGTILHEMGHVVGLQHEQSRADRDDFVSVLYANLIKSTRPNFDKVPDDAQAFTLYDWASLMHYPAFVDSKYGLPTIETIPAGMPLGLGRAGGYSSGDIDGVKRLYGATPSTITIDSNPSGLKLIVDGVTVTTPKSFSWALGSTHTLDVPAGAQALSGFAYAYGRWNDDPAASHVITVNPGRGLITEPAKAPTVTTYLASFIELVPYTASVQGSGTMTPSPLPQSYSGVGGQWYVARLSVTLSATPNAGSAFYQFLNSPYWLPGALSVNPKTFVVPDDAVNAVNVLTQFTSSPVTTITSNPAGLPVLVDGGYWIAPKNFSPAFDSGWAAGSTHGVSVYDPSYPYSSTIRYAFGSWSDGGALTHNFVVPAASSTLAVNFTPQFYVIAQTNPACGGNVGVAPASPTADGFYANGTSLSYLQTPAGGWSFTGWSDDLSGTANPQNLVANDEQLVTANYNTVATPFSVASLSPPNALAGSGSFTLTVNGSGFTPATGVFVNNVYRAPTYVSPSQITLAMTSTDVATPGAFQIFVQNFPDGAPCAVYGTKSFTVGAKPLLAPSPQKISFGNQVVGTSSATKAITLKNGSSGAISIASIVASGDYAQSNDCPASLAKSASCTVTVSFRPTVAGSINGAITITDSVPDSPQVAALTGKGVLPLSFSPSSLSFGNVAVGGSSPAKTLTLTNNSAAALAVSASASGNYSVAAGGGTPCAASLAAGASCTLSAVFAPKVPGSISGAVTLSYAGTGGPQAVPLSGTGTGGSAPPLGFSPTSLSFSTTAIGVTSSAKTVTVTNTGATTLTLAVPTASANYAASGCTGSLGAGANCTLSVTFTPSVAATVNGAVTLATGAAASPQVLAVSGSGTAPLKLSPTSITFANQAVSTTSLAQIVTLKNYGAATVSLSSVTASGQFIVAPGGATPCGASLAHNASCTLAVSFAPRSIGTRTGAVTITSSAGASSPQVVNLSGVGE